jgi:DNA N-6-adenine-methyltransferase (Dam)/Protein of unknown function (DUF3102)
MHGNFPQTGDNVDARLSSLADAIKHAHADASRHARASATSALEAGKALLAAQALLRHGQWLPWLKANVGIPKSTASLYMQAAKDRHHIEMSNVGHLSLRGMIREIQGRGGSNNEHYTPSEYVEAARRVLGEIDLDPASCAKANEVVRACKFYTKTDDGLTRPWRGRVWLNPPYCGQTGHFVEKLVDEYRAGNVTAAIVMLHVRPAGCPWFAPLWDHGLLCFASCRIRMWNTTANPINESVFVYFGSRRSAFKREFERFGTLAVRYEDRRRR